MAAVKAAAQKDPKNLMRTAVFGCFTSLNLLLQSPTMFQCCICVLLLVLHFSFRVGMLVALQARPL